MDKYYGDYPKEKIGLGNPYWACASCGRSDPAINGRLEGHAPHCEYRKRKERENLQWQKGLPKEPGYYWVRNLTAFAEERARIFEVREYRGDMAIDNSTLSEWPGIEESEWHGPIVQPE